MNLLLILLTVLESFLAAIQQEPFSTAFTMTINENPTQPISMTGTLVMEGEKFLVHTSDMDVAYDGKTMYLYQADVNELTLTNPTPEDLLTANPICFAKALAKNSSVIEKPSQTGAQTSIIFTPKDNSLGIQRFTLRVINEYMVPVWMEMKEGTKTTVISMKNPQYIYEAPEFKLEKPGAVLNDMR